MLILSLISSGLRYRAFLTLGQSSISNVTSLNINLHLHISAPHPPPPPHFSKSHLKSLRAYTRETTVVLGRLIDCKLTFSKWWCINHLFVVGVIQTRFCTEWYLTLNLLQHINAKTCMHIFSLIGTPLTKLTQMLKFDEILVGDDTVCITIRTSYYNIYIMF